MPNTVSRLKSTDSLAQWSDKINSMMDSLDSYIQTSGSIVATSPSAKDLIVYNSGWQNFAATGVITVDTVTTSPSRTVTFKINPSLITGATGLSTVDTAADQLLIYDASAGLLKNVFVSNVQSAATPPGGSTTQLQYNNAGAFAGATGVTYTAASDTLTTTNFVARGNVTVDTNTFFVNSTTNRVGIGNTTPSYTLDVTGDINSSGVYRINGTQILSSTTLASSVTSASGLTSIGTLTSLNVATSGNFGTTVTATTFNGNLNGNASTVTNGVYTTGSYANPAWITSLAGSKITGNISGNAANITAYTINQSLSSTSPVQFGALTIASDNPQITFNEDGTAVDNWTIVVDGDVFGIRYANAYPGIFNATTTGLVGFGVIPSTKLHVGYNNSGIPTTTGTTMTGVTARLASGSSSQFSIDIGSYSSGEGFIQTRSSTDHSVNYPLIVHPNGGNVCIGATGPIYQFQVVGSGQTTSAITDSGNKGGSVFIRDTGTLSGNGGALLFGAAVNNGYLPQSAIKSLLQNGTNNGTGDLTFSTRNATTDSALTERIRITYDGNVGIGNSSPTNKLEVTGVIKASSYIVSGSKYLVSGKFAGGAIGSTSPLAGATENYDPGGNFNTTSGEFTAPQVGYYLCNISYLTPNDSSTADLKWKKNNNNVPGGTITNGSPSGHKKISHSIVISADTVGDKFTLISNGTSNIHTDSEQNSFSIILL